jgi:beta-lactamase superfamily II metal-dependent hydrolase
MARLVPPETGVTVRMYRQGHGDCFLLCTKGEDGQGVYILIDCGLWGGSQVPGGPSIAEVVADIAEATGRRLDVLVITHEHMDHVNGFDAKAADGSWAWDSFTEISELWLAWTEDGTDPDAIALRERFNDVLVGLAAAAAQPDNFGLAADGRTAGLIRDVLVAHTGEEDVTKIASMLRTGGGVGLGIDGQTQLAVEGMTNKKAMSRMRGKAGRVRFLAPERGPQAVLRGAGLRAFALGPPRDAKLLLSLDPKDAEEFKFRLDGPSRMVLAALNDAAGEDQPFAPGRGRAATNLTGSDREFFNRHYGRAKIHPDAWRRIDTDWADATEALALRLNDEVNNTSLVLAFELPRTRKVLLFPGDAQRGNWLSWAPLEWVDGAGKVTARDLLGRVVLYKVGHHGSHNATLNGDVSSTHPHLGWLATGAAADEFVVMIPAHEAWANGKKYPWPHPLPAIERALMAKTEGRLLRLDATSLPEPLPGTSQARWKAFTDRADVKPLYAVCSVSD